jgi:hypothetical protein
VKAWGDAVASMGKFISVDEGRVLLAEQKAIPTSWAPTADDMATDEQEPGNEPVVVDPATVQPVDAPKATDGTTQQQITRDILLSMPKVARAIEKYPNEPLVEYSYPENRYTILAYRAEDLLIRRSYVASKPEQKPKEKTFLQKLLKWDQ